MRNQVISTALLALVFIFNYISTSGAIGDNMTNLANIFPFPYMPPGWVFGVARGTIYLGLLCYIFFIRSKKGITSAVVEKIRPWFRITCILNILWITATAMERYVISVALIASLFLVLGTILTIIASTSLHKEEKIFVKIPFGLYYGWVSLATSIVGISQFVYQRNVELPLGQTWTIIVVGTGLLVATYSRLRRRNIGQLLISLLAFAGIASVLF